mmetsp:Transcript_100518/g.203677  ORF Transcript_100518/g.203677 Transcript_100518/m.203677 type:complete len:88 (+) Transcript_100518:437-700(+)
MRATLCRGSGIGGALQLRFVNLRNRLMEDVAVAEVGSDARLREADCQWVQQAPTAATARFPFIVRHSFRAPSASMDSSSQPEGSYLP